MKILSFFITLLFCSHCYSQSTINKVIVRDHRAGHNPEPVQVFNITSLAPLFFTDKFDKAFRQSDVIGNDFYGLQRIGTAYANNHPYERSDYVPIDGYKRTFTGKGYKYEFHNGSIDDDLTVYIESFDPLISQYAEKLRSYGEYFEKSFNIIEGEVDIHDALHKYYKTPFPIPKAAPGRYDRQFADIINLYGAWVVERGSLGKKNNHEIHPLEQFWWRNDSKRYTSNSVDYYLNMAVDNSGRFESADDFDDDDGELVKPWGASPLDGTFAIQFEVDRFKKEKLIYTVNEIYSFNTKAPENDPRYHHLIIGSDTLISIKETMQTNTVSISFSDVGYLSDNSPNTNKIKGFIVIKTQVSGKQGTGPLGLGSDYAGSLRLHVNKTTVSTIINTYKLEFVKISRLENNSFRYFDAERNKLYSFPQPVPPGFNEQSVFIELSAPGQSKKMIEIAGLSKGSDRSLSGLSYTYKRSLVNYIQATIRCYTDRSKQMQLGELIYNKVPPREGIFEGADNTSLLFQIPESSMPSKMKKDNEQTGENNETGYYTVTVGIFKLFFKVSTLLQPSDSNIKIQ